MKPTVHQVAADICARLTSLLSDSCVNREQVVANLIQPLVEPEPAPESISQSRARFEMWITLPPIEASISRWPKSGAWPDQYRDYKVELAWQAWRESQRGEA